MFKKLKSQVQEAVGDRIGQLSTSNLFSPGQTSHEV